MAAIDRVNRARALFDRGRPDEARALCQQVLKLEPRQFDALTLLGILSAEQNLLSAEQNRYREADELLERAVSVRPNSPVAHLNRGRILSEQGRFEEAVASYDRAIELRPDYADAYSNRGTVLRELNRWHEALESLDRAIAIEPRHADAHANRGVILQDLNRVADAIASYSRAIEMRAEFARAYQSRGCARLLSGDLIEGWKDWEWRWRFESHLVKLYSRFSRPQWRAQPLRGKTILLWAEQGFGDTLQFGRYVPLVAQLGAHVILDVAPQLRRLLGCLEGVEWLPAPGETVHHFDYHCPLMSLPLAFGTTLESIPAGPYLRADGGAVGAWRPRIGESGKLRVGLVWSGGFRPNQPWLWAMNARRNIPLCAFAPLGDVAGVEFYSLQKGEPGESELRELRAAGTWGGPDIIDRTVDLADFADTAALIANLDLVISVDTATAHLAGAMGKPVWLLNRFDTCWRWLLGRADTPWYPTMRIYRQELPGDWEGVIRHVRDDLRGASSQSVIAS